jgi:hypothetical protein
MRSFIFLILAAASLIAQTPASPLTTEIRAIIDEYENSVRANTQKLIAAATEEEKNKYRASIPSAGPCATKMMALVQSNLDQTGCGERIELAGDGSREFSRGTGGAQNAWQHLCGPQGIAEAVKQLEYHGLPAEPVLKAVIEKNTNREERAAALYALGAVHFKNFDASADRVSAAASKDKALECFQQLNSDFADVTIQGFKLSDFAPPRCCLK